MMIITDENIELECLKEEVEEAKECINDFGNDFLDGVKYSQFCKEYPNLKNVIRKYFRYIGYKTDDFSMAKMWNNNEFLDWDDRDWKLIFKACDKLLSGKKLDFREIINLGV